MAKSKKKNIKNKPKKVETRISNVPKEIKIEVDTLYYKDGMTTADIADALKVPVTKVIKDLMLLGIMCSQNDQIDFETAEVLAAEEGIELKAEVVTDLHRFDEIEIEDDVKDLIERPCVVTIMGHVDHGKTTLLDTIRDTQVTAGEAGGITQHIGAYQVEKNGKVTTFIDTPGHAAFTEMRARGASVTDIAILVVAADDGVMPQTKEAIEHAQSAEVPIIVAVNKMDKEGANPERVMTELTEFNLVSEAWGGTTIFCEISALKNEGIDNLLEMINLQAEILELKANPNRHAMGTIIEAHLDKNRGPVATLLVQNGTLEIKDILVAGNTYGKIRSMHDDFGHNMSKATPSQAVEIVGLNDVPTAGQKFMVINDEKRARQIAEKRTHEAFNASHGIGRPVHLDDLFDRMSSGQLKELHIIIKADKQGSIEALRGLLGKIDVEGLKIKIVRSDVGNITPSDITLAKASNSIIIGYHIRPDAATRKLAKDEDVDIELYDIIYKVEEDLTAALKGMLDPVFEEVVTGQAEIRDTIKISKVGTIAGCYVTEGHIERNSLVRLIRDGIVVYEGKLQSLKRFKDEVKEVKTGYECGMKIENYDDVKIGDIIEASVEREIKR